MVVVGRNIKSKYMEQILKQIEEKKIELRNLENELEKRAIEKYGNMEGKFFSLAGTCKIKITKVIDVDERYRTLTVDCIRIQGGKYDNGRIEVDPYDTYNISLTDIDEERITEITKDQFIAFLNEATDKTKEIVLNEDL